MNNDWYYIPEGISSETQEAQELERMAAEDAFNDFVDSLLGLTPEKAKEVARVLLAANDVCNYGTQRKLDTLQTALEECGLDFPEVYDAD